MKRIKLIKIASIISIIGNLVLSISKILLGFIAKSAAVIGDGIDSLSDIFISMITLVTSNIINRPPDREHPYGHFRFETIATSILAFIMFFIGGQLCITTFEKIMYHKQIEIPGLISVYVTIFSIAGKIILSLSQFIIGKKAKSEMIKANGKNMLNDIITSTGVLIGLGFIYYFNLPIIDKIIAILIGIWIMISAVKIFIGTIHEIMEGETNMDLYQKVFDEVRKMNYFSNPHRVRLRKLGIYYIIEFDVEVDGHSTIKDAHDKVILLEKNIRESIPYIYDIIIHIEPQGNDEKNECWGLTEDDIS